MVAAHHGKGEGPSEQVGDMKHKVKLALAGIQVLYWGFCSAEPWPSGQLKRQKLLIKS